MDHTCELRGYLCYCDLEDCESEELPDDCTHFCDDEREDDCEDFEQAPRVSVGAGCAFC